MAPEVIQTSAKNVAAVILAAGLGRRMGLHGAGSKLLLPLRDRPLIRHVVDKVQASRLAPHCLVVGHCAADIGASVASTGIRTVFNPDFAVGQASSLIVGLETVADRCSAAMFLLGDQPLVSADLIDTLIDAHRQGGADITLPVWRGQRGNPVIVAARLFPELRQLKGDTGARALFASHQDGIRAVAVSDHAVVLDVDTPGDYARLGVSPLL